MKAKKEPEYDKAVADKIVNRKGTKKSKMQSLKDIGCSVNQIADLLNINTGNVTNNLNGVYDRFAKRQKKKGDNKPMKKQIDNSNLITVAHYARKIDKTVQWVYTLIKDKKIESEIIDGAIFVKCS